MSFRQLIAPKQHGALLSIDKMNSNSYSVHYRLFLYREELRRHRANFIHISKAKLQLTDTLISNTIRNISAYAKDEIGNMKREILFQRQLYIKMVKIRQLQRLGIKDIDPNYIRSDDI